jgi:threonine dehydratase
MNIDMIRAAAKRIEGHARRTPLLSSPFLDDIAGKRILVKPECLQHTGSFKFRGGWSSVSALTDNALKAGVMAFSSGNHAQGVAAAAKAHDTAAVILMPDDAPVMKIENTRALGAEVILFDRNTADREAMAAELSETRGLTLIKPFDNAEVIAGQGTIGLEIAEDAETLGITTADVTVCCGGGGLTSGIALALAADASGMIARPVEPEGFDDATRSLISGQIETNPTQTGSVCDAILTQAPGHLTFPIMKELCGPGIVVSEEEVLDTMSHAFERLKLVVEPGGAVALAAALFHADSLNHDTVIAVITGGNVDAPIFSRALARRS